MIEGSKEGPLLKPGEILIPTLLARGMKVKAGRHRRAGRDQPGRLGQRQDFHRPRNTWKACRARAGGTATSTSTTRGTCSG